MINNIHRQTKTFWSSVKKVNFMLIVIPHTNKTTTRPASITKEQTLTNNTQSRIFVRNEINAITGLLLVVIITTSQGKAFERRKKSFFVELWDDVSGMVRVLVPYVLAYFFSFLIILIAIVVYLERRWSRMPSIVSREAKRKKKLSRTLMIRRALGEFMMMNFSFKGEKIF